jgi:hypothetical protein
MTREEERFLRKARRYVNRRPHEKRLTFFRDHPILSWSCRRGRYWFAYLEEIDEGAVADSREAAIGIARQIIEVRWPLAKLE